LRAKAAVLAQLVGLAVIVSGCALLAAPLAWITGGLALIVTGTIAEWQNANSLEDESPSRMRPGPVETE
jgi:hypothetical protein